jgi:hypothetical protein
MKLTRKLPVELPTHDASLTRAFLPFATIPTLPGAAHHVNHVIRGNHIGWPLTPHVNVFRFSLAIYPLLGVSLYRTLTRRVEAGYWSGFLAFSAGMLAYVHIGPWAIEPPRDVMAPYTNPLAGCLAFGIVLALIASVVVGSLYAAALWHGHDD